MTLGGIKFFKIRRTTFQADKKREMRYLKGETNMKISGEKDWRLLRAKCATHLVMNGLPLMWSRVPSRDDLNSGYFKPRDLAKLFKVSGLMHLKGRSRAFMVEEIQSAASCSSSDLFGQREV